MKDNDDKQTRELELGIEHSYGYFDKRWCEECQEYRHFNSVSDISTINEHGEQVELQACSVCKNQIFVSKN